MARMRTKPRKRKGAPYGARVLAEEFSTVNAAPIKPRRIRAKRFGMGRLRVPDFRDHNFNVRRLMPKRSTRTRRTHYVRNVLDQGYTPHCVAFSSTAYGDAGPTRNFGAAWPFANPQELYDACQKIDEWPGEDYDGTSVRAAFKILRERGVVESYFWAFDIETVVDWVLEVGPMVVGTWWTEEMMYPKKGYVQLADRAIDPMIDGGHAYLIIGANKTKRNPDGTRGALRILNSWGKAWGDSGRVWISFGDFAKLLAADGEAACAIEIKLLSKLIRKLPVSARQHLPLRVLDAYASAAA